MPNPYLMLRDPWRGARPGQTIRGPLPDEEPPTPPAEFGPPEEGPESPALPGEAIQASAPELARLISSLGPGASGVVSPTGERKVTIAPRVWTPPGEKPTVESGTASWTPEPPGDISPTARRMGLYPGAPPGTYNSRTGIFTPRAEEERRAALMAEADPRKKDQRQNLLANVLSLARSYWGAADKERQARMAEGVNALNTLLRTELLPVPKGVTIIDRETGQPIVEDPATVAGRKVTEIMGGGMGRTVADLERQQDALRLLPVPTAQSLADDVQRRIDALEAVPGKKVQQEREAAREARDIEAHGIRVKESQERERERLERQKDREARRKRLEDAASGKNPLTVRELMTDRNGLLAEQRRLEDRFDITEEEKQSRMRQLDEELGLVHGELEKARRRERGAGGQSLSPRQQAAVDAAPEGHRFKLGGNWYVKQGGQLVPEGK